jgi:hypothetical protein
MIMCPEAVHLGSNVTIAALALLAATVRESFASATEA